MSEPDDLDAELRALGRTLVVAPPADDLVEQVLARLPAEPLAARPRDRWRTRRRRLVAVIIAVVIIGLGLTPPVRAAVVEWLRIGGVLIRTAAAGHRALAHPVAAADASGRGDPGPGQGAGGLPDRRTRRARSAGTDRRCPPTGGWWRWTGARGPTSCTWTSSTASCPGCSSSGTGDPFQVTSVDGQDAIWFATAHSISYLDREGRERNEPARIAGPCLVWERRWAAVG